MREDWIECNISDVSEVLNGDRGKNYPSRAHYIESGIPFISAGNIDENRKLNNELNYISEDRFELLIAGKLQKDDIVYCIRGSIGKFAIIDFEKGAIASSLCIIRTNKEIDRNYFCNYLASSLCNLEINRFDNGTAQPNLSAKNFKKFKLPLAPIPIQRAIVSKIEALFSNLDKGISDLKKAQKQLKIYRQAVLKKAFEGELTKEWREKNPYEMKSFLETLKKEKAEAFKNKLIAKSDYFPEFQTKDLIYMIPENWIYLPWKTIASNNKYAMKRGPFGSALKKEFFVEKGVVVYEQGHAINDDPYRHRYYISKDKFEELKAFEVKGGDMIISCSGVTLGRICLLPNNANTGVINQALLKIDMDEKIMIKKYFIMLFRSETFQRLIFGKSLGTAMPNMVGMKELKEIPIPIPPLKEQHQIVREIESRLSVCDKIEQNITESLKKSEALRQSILKKAFEGKLLSNVEIAKCKNEADYEPASELLKKIKAGGK